jgi:hypothetical protein
MGKLQMKRPIFDGVLAGPYLRTPAPVPAEFFSGIFHVAFCLLPKWIFARNYF